MSKIVAVANQKGGVGKTTTVVNLASCMAEKGKKVLLVDLDPQGNATSGCGINKKHIKYSTYDFLMSSENNNDNNDKYNKDNNKGNLKINEDRITTSTSYKNLYIMPSTINLAGAEIELVDIVNREALLKKALLSVQDFDYIFIDCPPSLGLLTLNALTASDSVLIPIQCEFYALEGLSQLTNTIKQVKRLYNNKLEIEGVLVTMYDSRLNLTTQVLAEVKKFFADKIFKTVIPRNIKISEAPSYGMPINYYDKNAKGTIAYQELAQELINSVSKL
ncbi:MAG: soj [Clostridia bacterium]|nr:soj [Clostridia bacterium]